MITVLGAPSGPEREAAEALRRAALAVWPAAADSDDYDVRLVAGARCYGERYQDIDVLLFARLAEPARLDTRAGHRLQVSGLCVAIEVKDHAGDAVRFEGGHVKVRYRGGWSSATEQSQGQLYSVKGYLERHGREPPFVRTAILLRNVPRRSLPRCQTNVIGGDFKWFDLLAAVATADELSGRAQVGLRRGYVSTDAYEAMVEPFTRVLQPTSLDRRRMELLTKREAMTRDLRALLGDKLVLLRGRAGSGKTAHLLRLAMTLNRDEGRDVLVLTYNVALVADLRRLLTLLSVTERGSRPRVRIQSVHAFVVGLLRAFGLDLPEGPALFERFESLEADALELAQAMRVEEREALKREAPEALAWDHVLVDEGQDWPAAERDLLLALYGPGALVVAAGYDQLTRAAAPTSWTRALPRASSETLNLRRILRLKSGLARFVGRFVHHLGLEDPGLEVNPDMLGGRVIVSTRPVMGDADLHRDLIAACRRDGNQPVDALYCVPPSLVERGGAERRCLLADALRGFGYEVWDATSRAERRAFPSSTEQFRLVQYESCRGLEGWVVVAADLDELYRWKLESYDPSLVDPDAASPNDAARDFARRWLIIPVTRAIDTLVITVRDSSSEVARALRAVSLESPGMVEWRE